MEGGASLSHKETEPSVQDLKSIWATLMSVTKGHIQLPCTDKAFLVAHGLCCWHFVKYLQCHP